MAGAHFFLELEPPEERLRDVPHVVIVGGGFAGIHACKALAHANVRITLIDKRNFNLFQPLLYQVSTGLVSRGDIATPLRELVGKQRNVQVCWASDERHPEGSRSSSTGRLQLRPSGAGHGIRQHYFGHDDWRTFAPPMKILEHAEEIRRRLLMAMEQAEQTPDPSARQFLQTVVIVGAGPSGCEMAGAVSELMRWALNNAFKQLDPNKTRIVLVDPGERVLRAMPAQQSDAALAALERDGIEFIAKSRVQTMRPGEVIIGTPDGDRRIQAATVIWTAGVRPSHLGSKLAEATGCALDKAGRVVVQHDFSIPEHPEIRVAGDLSNYSHTINGKPMPGMAAPAKQAGTFIGKDIAAIVANRARPTFSYFDFGSMAVLDRATAVADLRGLRFSGGVGWLLWAFVHLVLIPDWENRITLSVKWIFALLTQQRAAILLTGMPSQHMALDAADAHFPMKVGEGVSIAEPDAALKAAMDYYSNQMSGSPLSGQPPTQELLDTSDGSAADSAAAIK